MKRRSKARKLMIMDACVLIDFIKTDRTILELIVKHVGPVYVISPIIEEIDDIDDESELQELGLVIEERFILLGINQSLQVLVVCHCYRKDDSEIRIISARKATKKEQIVYFRRLS